MKKLFAIALTMLMLAQGAAAQEAPVPHRSPRVPVSREALPGRKPAIPASRTVEGAATIIDTDKLRVGDVELRLFGIVPPQLSASFGPQARAALDSLVAGQAVSCLIRDRDHDGRFLATCHNGSGNDLALELLKRGLAVTARGSLSSTDLATPYIIAEQAAEAQKLGLWSVAVQVAAVPAAAAPPKAEPAPLPVIAPVPAAVPAPIPALLAMPAAAKKMDSRLSDDVQARVSSAAVPVSAASASADDAASDAPGFFARYQLLITGIIMLATVFSIMTVISRQRRQERCDEMKAIAAALRGELMAMRAVCQGRIKTLVTEADDKNAAWPRIRSTLYQAYVGRLGWLGAELARQVASIYGQASDYAAYYNTAGEGEDTRREAMPKRQALQNLVQYIEAVLPRLAVIEQTGDIANLKSLPPGKLPAVDYATMRAPDAAHAAEQTQAPAAAALKPLWNAMRDFARERFTEKKTGDENEYAAMIEAEMAGLTFTETGEDADKLPDLPDNVTKLRETGS